MGRIVQFALAAILLKLVSGTFPGRPCPCYSAKIATLQLCIFTILVLHIEVSHVTVYCNDMG